jgi:glutamate racemase
MGVDTIVLGCTHFIFLKEIIISMFGDTFTVLDPATAVAKQTLKLYSEIRTEKPVSNSQNEDLFYTSGDIESFGRFIKKWLKLDTEKVYKIDLECLKN